MQIRPINKIVLDIVPLIWIRIPLEKKEKKILTEMKQTKKRQTFFWGRKLRLWW